MKKKIIIKAGILTTSDCRGQRCQVLKDNKTGIHYIKIGDEPERTINEESMDHLSINIVVPGPKFHYGVLRNPILENVNVFGELFPEKKKHGYNVSHMSESKYEYDNFAISDALMKIVNNVISLYGGVHFDLISHENGTTSVFMKADRIIASRYIAQIDPASLCFS